MDLLPYQNRFNINQSFLKNVFNFLDPLVSYGGTIPDITPSLRDQILVCLQDELSSLGEEVQKANIIVILGDLDSDSFRGQFTPSNKIHRILTLEIQFRPVVEIYDRSVVENRISLNLQPNGNLRFWDTKNSKTFGDWEEISGLYLHSTSSSLTQYSESGLDFKEIAVSTLHPRR